MKVQTLPGNLGMQLGNAGISQPPALREFPFSIPCTIRVFQPLFTVSQPSGIRSKPLPPKGGSLRALRMGKGQNSLKTCQYELLKENVCA
jgi:hypothetical protein